MAQHPDQANYRCPACDEDWPDPECPRCGGSNHLFWEDLTEEEQAAVLASWYEA